MHKLEIVHIPTWCITHTTLKLVGSVELTIICRFMVMVNRTMKYSTRIGQNTGMLKTEKHVQVSAMKVARVMEYLWKSRKRSIKCTSSFARFSYSECGLRSLRSLTHMGVMRQGGNVTKFL